MYTYTHIYINKYIYNTLSKCMLTLQSTALPITICFSTTNQDNDLLHLDDSLDLLPFFAIFTLEIVLDVIQTRMVPR